MTSRERIVQAFRHQEPDRTPVFEYVLNSREITEGVLKRPPAFLDWDECVREKSWKNAVRQSAVDRLDIAEFFGHDMLYETPNRIPPVEKPATAGCDIPKNDDPVEIVAERNRRKRESTPAISEDSFLVYEFLKEEMGKRGFDLPILVPAYSHGVWTDIDLMQTMLLAPEVILLDEPVSALDAESARLVEDKAESLIAH